MNFIKHSLLIILLALTPLQAYNYSWSTHEDITTGQLDTPPGECEGSECEGKPDWNVPYKVDNYLK